MADSTLVKETPRLTVRRLLVRVVHGPDAGMEVVVDGDRLTIGTQAGNDLVLTDPTVSRQHAELVHRGSGVMLRDRDSRNGTFVGPARVQQVELAGAGAFRVGDTELRFDPGVGAEVTASDASYFEGIAGRSVPMRELFSFIERVGPTDLPVLVIGETGVGKELVSRAVHERSQRAGDSYVVFDCSTVVDTLVASELFGHNKGAFTGATESREGVFERAHGGTVFLDEVGELPLPLQSKLLRVLELGQVRRVGGQKVRHVDVRVVAATNRDLRVEVAQGRFRQDLFYRLAVVEIRIAPLRERLEDIAPLVDHFLRTAPFTHGVVSVSDEVLDVLRGWHWPGNVRELRNVVLRALPFCEGSSLAESALPPAFADVAPAAESAEGVLPTPRATQKFRLARQELLDAFERAYLVDLMARAGGSLSRAGRLAGMDRRTVGRMLRFHGLRDDAS